MMKTICLKAIVAMAALLLGAGVALGNLIVNGDFEAGNTGFATEYKYEPGYVSGGLPEGSYGITDDPTKLHWATVSYGDHTTGDGLMMMINGANSPYSLLWSQTVAVPSFETMNFSMWGSSWVSIDYPPATLAFFVNSVQIGPTYTTPETSGIWTQFETEWTSGASGAVDLELRLVSTHGLGNDFAIDDLVLTPEPSSVSLLALAGLIGSLAHRRVRA